LDDNKHDDAKQYTYFTGNFDCHGNAVVQCRAHGSMEHTPGFTKSHWMLRLGVCLGRIALAAAMVTNF
jgi:hypothetical protein